MAGSYNPLAPFVATSSVSVSPSDSTDLSFFALDVGTTGDIQVTDYNGHVTIFSSVAVGILPIAGTRVWSANTTAQNIVALF